MSILSDQNKIVLVKRLKSFLWRIGMMSLVAFVDFAAVNLELFDPPSLAVVIAGLALGEVSKWLNKRKNPSGVQ